MGDVTAQFIEYMRSHGVEPADTRDIRPGEFVRFDVAGKPKGNKNGWCRFYDDETPAGVFGDWSQGTLDGIKWKFDRNPGRELSEAERKAYAAKRKAREKERQAELERVHAECAAWCKMVWPACQAAPVDHPYLERKGVLPYIARIAQDGRLIIPVTKHGSLVGFQFIAEDGEKKFKFGTDITGGYATIGRPVDQVIIAEGFATASTIHQATGIPTIVAFNAGNLEPVALAIKERLPDAKITIAIDDDRFSKGNAGLTHGMKAAAAVSGEIARPQFKPGVAGKPTDFNDVAEIYGNDEVRRQIVTGRSGWFEEPKPQPVREPQLNPFESAPEQVGYLDSHSQVSAMLSESASDRLLFDADIGHWYQYGNIWDRKDSAVVKRELLSFLDKRRTKGCSTSFFNGVFKMLEIRLARSQTAAVDGDGRYWNEARNLIPLSNGVLDIEARNLIPHSSELMFNWALPHAYDPKAACPTIDRLLENIAQEDPANLELLNAYLAAIFYGMPELQKYLEIVGKPGTGKSTFMKIATELVGTKNVVSTTFENLEKNRFETASFYGKRLAIIPDADQWSGSFEIFKSITGQDAIRFEEKNVQQSKPFLFKGMVIVSANAPISSSDMTTAMMRRRIPLRIDKRFDPSKIDPMLDHKIRAEIPGLINKLLAMDVDQVKATLRSRTPEGKAAEKRALVDTNSIAEWIENCCVVDFNSTIAVGRLERVGMAITNADKSLYANYFAYCEATGRRSPVSWVRFSNLLIELCEACEIPIQKKRSNGTMIVGLRFRRFDTSSGLTDRDVPTPILNETPDE